MNSPVLMTGAGEGAVGKFETSNGIAHTTGARREWLQVKLLMQKIRTSVTNHILLLE